MGRRAMRIEVQGMVRRAKQKRRWVESVGGTRDCRGRKRMYRTLTLIKVAKK